MIELSIVTVCPAVSMIHSLPYPTIPPELPRLLEYPNLGIISASFINLITGLCPSRLSIRPKRKPLSPFLSVPAMLVFLMLITSLSYSKITFPFTIPAMLPE